MAETVVTPPMADAERDWRATLAIELSKMAVGRLQNRQKVEWQVNLSLWTFFILVAHAALTHQHMGPAATLALLLLSVGISVILAGGYVYFRLMLEKRNRSEQATAYYWETCAEHFAQYQTRPDAHLPPWKRYVYGNSAPVRAQNNFLSLYWSPITQIGITCVFSVLAPSVLVIRLLELHLPGISPPAP